MSRQIWTTRQHGTYWLAAIGGVSIFSLLFLLPTARAAAPGDNGQQGQFGDEQGAFGIFGKESEESEIGELDSYPSGQSRQVQPGNQGQSDQQFGDEQGAFGIFGKESEVGPSSNYRTGQYLQDEGGSQSQDDQQFGDEQGAFGIFGRQSQISQWNTYRTGQYPPYGSQQSKQVAQGQQPGYGYRVYSPSQAGQSPQSQLGNRDQGHERAGLGVTLGENLQGSALVTNIVPNSPASRAGLQAGDRITAIDQQPVRSYGDVIRIIGGHRPNEQVLLHVDRNGQQSSMSATLVASESIEQSGHAAVSHSNRGP